MQGWIVVIITCTSVLVCALALCCLVNVCAHFRPRIAHRCFVMRDSGEPPQFFLPPRCNYHLFLSHCWQSGQDQAAVIKRQMTALLPGPAACPLHVFLDVDDLKETSHLEQYVQQSAVVLLFLSRGYFLSFNCLREMRTALTADKPLVLVHETKQSKGGAQLDELFFECPAPLRSQVFSGAPDPSSVLESEALITWHRMRDYQRLALLRIAQRVLPACSATEPLHWAPARGSLWGTRKVTDLEHSERTNGTGRSTGGGSNGGSGRSERSGSFITGSEKPGSGWNLVGVGSTADGAQHSGRAAQPSDGGGDGHQGQRRRCSLFTHVGNLRALGGGISATLPRVPAASMDTTQDEWTIDDSTTAATIDTPPDTPPDTRDALNPNLNAEVHIASPPPSPPAGVPSGVRQNSRTSRASRAIAMARRRLSRVSAAAADNARTAVAKATAVGPIARPGHTLYDPMALTEQPLTLFTHVVLFVSRHNLGALEVAEEMKAYLDSLRGKESEWIKDKYMDKATKRRLRDAFDLQVDGATTKQSLTITQDLKFLRASSALDPSACNSACGLRFGRLLLLPAPCLPLIWRCSPRSVLSVCGVCLWVCARSQACGRRLPDAVDAAAAQQGHVPRTG